MSLLILFCGLLLLQSIYIYIRNSGGKLPTPPGPICLPVVGNALQLPKEHAWLAFSKWSRVYGPVMYLSTLGAPMIVLSSRQAISDLLEKRSATYSDRPLAPMAGELAGFRKYTAFVAYGSRHREGRRLIQSTLTAQKMPGLHAIQEAKVAEFVSRLTQSPREFRSHARWLVAAIVLQITYGIAAGGSDDPFVSAIGDFMENLSQITAPGAYLVDSFHFLKYLPEWLPFTSFKTRAREIGESLDRLEKKLYLVTRMQMERGDATSSFVADFLSGRETTAEEQKLCQEVATSFYGAGADTTVSALLSFILIMAQQPLIQQRAQSEVDAVVTDWPPKCSDRKNMPYLDAVLKEVYRCNPVVPLALPHQVLSEDVYAGYRIPAGSTVFANTWAVLHDPELYPAPDEVRPERYLDKVGNHVNPDPRDFAFGYGRRVCPGRVLAEDTLFVSAASLLASFDITDARPLKGDKIGYTGGIISHPEDFTCNIAPRRHT